MSDTSSNPATDAGGSIESWRGRTRLGTFFDSIVAMAALLRM